MKRNEMEKFLKEARDTVNDCFSTLQERLSDHMLDDREFFQSESEAIESFFDAEMEATMDNLWTEVDVDNVAHLVALSFMIKSYRNKS